MKPPKRFFEFNPTDEELMDIFETTDRTAIEKRFIDESGEYYFENNSILDLCDLRNDGESICELLGYMWEHCPEHAINLSGRI